MPNHPIIQTLLPLVRGYKASRLNKEVILNIVKEELQNHILYALYSNPKTSEMIFYGGTSLRKIYGLNRLSEDLDFEIEKELPASTIEEVILNYFKSIALGKVYSLKQENNVVQRVTFKFPILYDLELSPLRDENIHVKVEMSKTLGKKLGVISKSALSLSNLSMLIRHYDIETLMASKIVACINRVERKKGKEVISFKGRDFYDLLWYMSKSIKPNEERLKSQLEMNTTEVFEKLDERVKSINSEELFSELSDYFIDTRFIRNWCDNFHSQYAQYRKQY